MKHAGIILFYVVAVIAAVYARTVQILYLTEENSGLFIPGAESAAIALAVFIVLAVAAACFISCLSARVPKGSPKGTPVISAAYVLFAAACLFECLCVDYYAASYFLAMLTRLFAALSSLCLLLGAFSKRFVSANGAVRTVLLVPVAFLLLKLVSVFTAYAAVSVVASNVFYLAFLAGATVYMLLMAKFENGITPRRSSYSLLPATVFVTAAACCCVVPWIITAMLGRSELLHDRPDSLVLCAAFAVFANVYTFSVYRRENLLEEDAASEDGETPCSDSAGEPGE